MKPKIAVLAVASHTGEVGGAERLFVGLSKALRDIGVDATIISAPSDERGIDQILGSYLRFYDLDLSGYDGVISTKAPSYAARHLNHICYLMHTMRVFYDMFDEEFPNPSQELREQRMFVQSLDTALLSRPRLKGLFAIGAEVAQRTLQFNGLVVDDFIRHPSTLGGLGEGNFGYLFLPGRLHRWKRVDLAIDAVRRSDAPLRLLISGDGEDAEALRDRAAGDHRITFLGRVTEERLKQLYADCLAVVFTPKSEDLGLVTLEAFECGKPVITCVDSGEPARIVQHGETGYICSADPDSIARAMKNLTFDPARARSMGNFGRASVADVTWENVARRLAAALGLDACRT
ncbi:glycosyltransferase family 4 protein [Rhodoblastus sp.]|jgi:glycosyltransferase involved in cell wall biosynthesis|uniref:glycosyltransferase family 4 protein n=1 Tax=Rhodoblastus sp. TaxID=1962975 RepID=UPI0026267F43|nr:glycosyltransferase family 4 protein [Rhodoblastus sp.]